MQLILERKVHNENSTEGNLYIDHKWFCHTIEDRVRALPGQWKAELKVYGKTAIPYGTYAVLVTYSNKFKRMLTGIFNVPDFEGIRMHNGSSENSSAGCIILSYKDDDGADHQKNRIVNDVKAMNDLCNIIEHAQQKEKIWIEIVDSKEQASDWPK